MLLAAPALAIGHLMATWVPRVLAAKRLTHSVRQQANAVEQHLDQLTQAQADTARLRTLAETHSHPAEKRWLPQREHYNVSNTLAKTLQSNGVTVERLLFEEPTLYAVVPPGDALACEQVTVVCRGPYTGMTECLDQLVELDLPIHLTHLAWQRREQGIELALEMQIPFAPDGPLEAALRRAAGLGE
jgi:hypothetical protein